MNGQHTPTHVLFGPHGDAGGRIDDLEIAFCRGPIEELAQDRQHPIGLDGSTAVVDRVEQADDVWLADQIGPAVAEDRIDFALELALILGPTPLLRLGIALDEDLAQITQRSCAAPRSARLEGIAAIEDRMGRLVDDARVLGQDAAAASSTDVAEQASAMRQQIAAARNKIGLLRKSLAASLPEPPVLN